jgi:hypothetical protein
MCLNCSGSTQLLPVRDKSTLWKVADTSCSMILRGSICSLGALGFVGSVLLTPLVMCCSGCDTELNGTVTRFKVAVKCSRGCTK